MRWILIVVCVGLQACSSLHRVDQIKSAEAGKKVGEGVVYALPRSEIIASVPLTASLKTPGRFAHLSEKLLGEKAPLVAEKLIKLGEPELSTSARPDTGQVFVVRLGKSHAFESKSLVLTLNQYGLLTEAKSVSDNQTSDFLVSTATAGLGIASKDLLLGSVESARKDLFTEILEFEEGGPAVEVDQAKSATLEPVLAAGSLLRKLGALPHVPCLVNPLESGPGDLRQQHLWPSDLWPGELPEVRRDDQTWAYVKASVLRSLQNLKPGLLAAHAKLYEALESCRPLELQVLFEDLHPWIFTVPDSSSAAKEPSDQLEGALGRANAEALLQYLESATASGWLSHTATSRLFVSLQTVVAADVVAKIRALETSRQHLLLGKLNTPLMGAETFTARLEALDEEIASLRQLFLGKTTLAKTTARFRVADFAKDESELCLFVIHPGQGLLMGSSRPEKCTASAALETPVHPVFHADPSMAMTRKHRAVHLSVSMNESLASALPQDGEPPCTDHPRRDREKDATTGYCWKGAGFRYRVPNFGKVEMLSSAPAAVLSDGFDWDSPRSRRLAFSEALPFPQFGKTRWLPLKIGKSRKGTLGLALDEATGSIKKLEIATEGHKTDQISGLATAYNAYQDAELEVKKAELARLEAEIAKQDEVALLTREKQILELQAAITALTTSVPEDGISARQIGYDIPRLAPGADPP